MHISVTCFRIAKFKLFALAVKVIFLRMISEKRSNLVGKFNESEVLFCVAVAVV